MYKILYGKLGNIQIYIPEESVYCPRPRSGRGQYTLSEGMLICILPKLTTQYFVYYLFTFGMFCSQRAIYTIIALSHDQFGMFSSERAIYYLERAIYTFIDLSCDQF